MKTVQKFRLFLLLGIIFSINQVSAQGYQVGDSAMDFKLKNIDDKIVSMTSFENVKGYIVVFTCNHCPYSQAYEQRIIALDKKYAAKGFPVIAINPNDAKVQPEDSFEEMKKRAKKYKYTFPYLQDESQEVTKTYGATRTPHVYVIHKTVAGNHIEYIGAIDDNTEDAQKAQQKYVELAVDALLNGEKPAITATKAIGCTIKWKKDL